jgi:hypothetical protein
MPFAAQSSASDCRTLVGGGERGKNSAAHTEIGMTHVRTFFGASKAKGDSPEVVYIH